MQVNELLEVIHDAEIIGIYSKDSEKISVNIKTNPQTVVQLEFEDVRLFRFTDFVHQNIISRLLFINSVDYSQSDIEYYLKWVTSLSDSDSYLKQDSIEKIINQINSNELQLVYFEPSCGVEAVIVCRNFKILEIAKF